MGRHPHATVDVNELGVAGSGEGLRMFDPDVDATDDPDFIALVARIIIGAVLTHQPDDALVFQIDNWFGH
jgi:hypothetical protein